MVEHIKKFAHIILFDNILHIYLTLRILSVLECHTCDLSNQQAKELVSLLAVSLARPVKARSQKQNLLPP